MAMSKACSNKQSKHRCLDGLYHLDVIIGCGSFGKVYKALHNLSHCPVAIKIADRKAMDSDCLERFRLECSALKALRHRNLVQIYDYMETRRHVYLVMEYCRDGDLCAYMSNQGRSFLNENEARHIFRQLVEVVGFLHGRGWSHRDIKPANILLSHGFIKLTDFNLVSHPLKRINGLLATSCGTAQYAAPELIKGEAYVGSKVDIWSMGVTLFEITVGHVPFLGANEADTLKKIRNTELKIPERLSPQLQNLLEGCLRKDPNARLKMHEICSSVWFTLSTSPHNRAPKIPNLNEPFQLQENVVTELARITNTREKDLYEHLLTQPCDYYSASYHILKNHLTKEAISRLPPFSISLPRLKKAMCTSSEGIESTGLDTTAFPVAGDMTPARIFRKESTLHYLTLHGHPKTPRTPVAQLGQMPNGPGVNLTLCSSASSHRHAAFIRHTLQHQQPGSRLLQHSLSIRSTNQPPFQGTAALRHFSLNGAEFEDGLILETPRRMFLHQNDAVGVSVGGANALRFSPSLSRSMRHNNPISVGSQNGSGAMRGLLEMPRGCAGDEESDVNDLGEERISRLPSVLYPNLRRHSCAFQSRNGTPAMSGGSETVATDLLLDQIEELSMNVTGTSRSLEMNCSQLLSEVHETTEKNRSFSVNDLDQVLVETGSEEYGDDGQHFVNKDGEKEDGDAGTVVGDKAVSAADGDADATDKSAKRTYHFFTKLGRRLHLFPFPKRGTTSTTSGTTPQHQSEGVKRTGGECSPAWGSRAESTSDGSSGILCVAPGCSSSVENCHQADGQFTSNSASSSRNGNKKLKLKKQFSSSTGAPSTNSAATASSPPSSSRSRTRAITMQLPHAKELRCVSHVQDMLVCHPKLSIEEVFSRLRAEFARLRWDWKVKGNLIRIRKVLELEPGPMVQGSGPAPNLSKNILWSVYLELCYLGVSRSALCLRFKTHQPVETSGCVEMCYAALLNADLKSPPEDVLRETFMNH